MMVVNTTQLDQNTWVLELSGKLNFQTRHAFQNAITQAGNASPRQLILDLAHVTYVDSAGLSLLTLAHRNLSARSIQMDIANPQTVVRDVLLLTNMDKMFAFYDSAGAASKGSKNSRGPSYVVFIRLAFPSQPPNPAPPNDKWRSFVFSSIFHM